MGAPTVTKGSRFLIFWIFGNYQLNLGCQWNAKTKVEKAFFFICMSLRQEVFWAQKAQKVTT
jgi:hypothetical protein